MPGDRLLLISRAWFETTTNARVFEPLVADWQRECGSLSGARLIWCRIRGVASFASTFAIAFISEPRRPLPASLAWGTWLATEGFIALGIIVMYAIAIFRGDVRSAMNAELWLPSLASIAIPLAIVPVVIIFASRTTWAPHETRRACARIAIISFLLLIPLAGWVTPAANQRWREAVVHSQGHQTVPRGVRELTLPELFATKPAVNTMRDVERQRRGELHNRLGVMVMPFAIMTLALAASRLRRKAVVHAIAWWLACGTIWVALGGWAPHLIFLGIAAALHWWSSANLVSRVAHSDPSA